jgi:hypothetical protein
MPKKGVSKMTNNWLENLTGGNGDGRSASIAADLLENQRDLHDIDRMMNELAAQLNEQDLNNETKNMVENIGGYINSGLFSKVLDRIGGTYRVNRALGDSVVILEGEAKRHLHASGLAADLSLVITYKIFRVSVRLDKIQQVMEIASDETQELMTRVLAVQREHLFHNSNKLIEYFSADAIDMVMGSVNR